MQYPDIYSRCQYRTVEISPALADMQRRRVDDHSGVFDVIVGDACQSCTWKSDDSDCFVIAMEVLDNLPHDKVTRYGEINGDARWTESHVGFDTDGPFEVEEAVHDEYIVRVLDAWHRMYSQQSVAPNMRDGLNSAFDWLLMASGMPEPMYLPTGALQLFDTLHQMVPNHSLIASDFDFLPDVVVPGKMAPLVSSTVRSLYLNVYLLIFFCMCIFFMHG